MLNAFCKGYTVCQVVLLNRGSAKHSLDPGVIARWRKSLDKPLSQKFRQILLRLTGKEKRVKLRRDLPASFDARIKWRNCTSLNTVRDQSNCVSGF
ncbi:hypothetical protein RRG08_058350, partial [Elysia crispata]